MLSLRKSSMDTLSLDKLSLLLLGRKLLLCCRVAPIFASTRVLIFTAKHIPISGLPIIWRISGLRVPPLLDILVWRRLSLFSISIVGAVVHFRFWMEGTQVGRHRCPLSISRNLNYVTGSLVLVGAHWSYQRHQCVNEGAPFTVETAAGYCYSTYTHNWSCCVLYLFN